MHGQQFQAVNEQLSLRNQRYIAHKNARRKLLTLLLFSPEVDFFLQSQVKNISMEIFKE